MDVIILIVLVLVNMKLLHKTISNSDMFYKLFVSLLFIIHYTTFFISYKANIEINKDSYSFYYKALISTSISDFYSHGHKFMTLIIYPFVKIGMSYFSISLAFSTLSLIAFTKYSRYFSKEIKKNKYVLLSLLLIPSLHYWTSSLSKEALVFYFSTIILFEIYKKKYFTFPFFAAAIILLLIRPYLFFIVMTAYLVNIFINSNFSLKQKKTIFLSTVIIIIVTLPILQHFLKLETVSISNFKENYTKIIVYSQSHGGSSINLQDSNYIERLAIVVSRPLFFDAKTLAQYLVSIENLFVLILFIRTIYGLYKGKKNALRLKQHIFSLTFVIGIVSFLSIYMYNLGLASRMRVMFLPYLFFWMISILKTESYFCKKSIEEIN